MMDKQAGELIVKYAKAIAKRCYPFPAGKKEPTPAQERARNAAWRLMSHLPPVLEQIKESDLFWKLGDIATENGDKKEAKRCFALAHQADRSFVRPFNELERLLKEIEADEQKDPKAVKYAAQVAKAAKAQADAREQERLDKNEKARAARAAKKAAAAPVKAAAKKAAAKKTKK